MADVPTLEVSGPLGPFAAAMRLLHAGVDTTVIALWLGHEQVETTQMHLHADLAGRYRPPDTLLGFLDGP